MAARKRPPLRGFVKGKNPITVAPSETEVGRVGLLLEALSDKVDLLLEGMKIFHETLDRRITEMRVELSARLEALDSHVRHLADGVQRNTEGIRKNSEDHQEEQRRHQEEQR
ncbi:MAG: hypothetical protein HY904_02315 [Deltaproteobacteria bacterium]|nr:hypothetical protein [Deltaproteobacteria bacterium]